MTEFDKSVLAESGVQFGSFVRWRNPQMRPCQTPRCLTTGTGHPYISADTRVPLAVPDGQQAAAPAMMKR